MDISKFFYLIRMNINDIDAAKYSDYDLCIAYNKVLDNVYNTLSTMNTDALTHTADIDIIDQQAELPEDFFAILKVLSTDGELNTSNNLDKGHYKIIRNIIYADYPAVHIIYKSIFVPITVSDMNNDFPLPQYFINTLKEYISYMLENKDTSEIQSNVYKIAANASYSGFEMKPAFKV